MHSRKVTGAGPVPGRTTEERFSELLQVMKERYLRAGYELDDVHLAQILEVHDGVLRKGKAESVSPALAEAVGRTWQVDLNWLLLGTGRRPDPAGPPLGLNRLPAGLRVKRGNWDRRKVGQLLEEHGLMQKDLAERLGIDPGRAGGLVRGTLRDSALRERLADLLEVSPQELFLTAPLSPGRPEHEHSPDQEHRFSLGTVRLALESMLEQQLERALLERGAAAGELEYQPTELRLEVPPPPEELTGEHRRRYELNREVLERWSRTSAAFQVPPAIARRYCLEVVGFYEGGQVDDVGGLLRDFLQEDQARGDTRPAEAEGEPIRLLKGVLVVGGREVAVEDPELLARLPEYLASRAGRRRLLDWLRRNLHRGGD